MVLRTAGAGVLGGNRDCAAENDLVLVNNSEKIVKYLKKR
jgi:hypothetical protein